MTRTNTENMNRDGADAFAGKPVHKTDSAMYKEDDSDADPAMVDDAQMMREARMDENPLDEENVEDVEADYGDDAEFDTASEETEEEEYRAGGLQKTSQYVVDNQEPDMGEKTKEMRRSVEE